jgi:hypothetical protein
MIGEELLGLVTTNKEVVGLNTYKVYLMECK